LLLTQQSLRKKSLNTWIRKTMMKKIQLKNRHLKELLL
jgi:hypothetical protein